jgi:hypothetical protein
VELGERLHAPCGLFSDINDYYAKFTSLILVL